MLTVWLRGIGIHIYQITQRFYLIVGKISQVKIIEELDYFGSESEITGHSYHQEMQMDLANKV